VKGAKRDSCQNRDMSIVVTRLASLAAFLLVPAFLALAPGVAGAHGGHAREDAAAALPSEPPSRAVDERFDGDATDRISSPCPGKPASTCCCGGGAGCFGDGRLPFASCAGTAIFVPWPPARPPFSLRRVALESRVLPSASPRGPPFSS
jgi:hypothetical protein